jgi:hypothetical protein
VYGAAAYAPSLYLLVMTIMGLGIGPYVVGLLSDATGDLRWSMGGHSHRHPARTRMR